MDLAEGYMMTRDLERGMGLISNIIASFNILTGVVMFADYQGVSIGAKLQRMTGNIETAIYIWEDFKRFLLENQNLANNEEDLAYYWGMADKYLNELRNN